MAKHLSPVQHHQHGEDGVWATSYCGAEWWWSPQGLLRRATDLDMPHKYAFDIWVPFSNILSIDLNTSERPLTFYLEIILKADVDCCHSD